MSLPPAVPRLPQYLQFLATSDPVTLGEYALGAVALAYLSPALLGALGGSLRGYAGDIAPAAALDLLVNEGNVVLVDVRTAKEKETSGIPDLPSAASGKLVDVEYAVTEDKKLRGQLRDPASIEAQITALQIASLKKIGKGSKVVLLDRYGPAARTVAKEMSAKGYGKVYVIAGVCMCMRVRVCVRACVRACARGCGFEHTLTLVRSGFMLLQEEDGDELRCVVVQCHLSCTPFTGGFDGRGGWVSSKLQIKPAAVLSSAAPPSIAKTVFTRRALPAPKA